MKSLKRARLPSLYTAVSSHSVIDVQRTYDIDERSVDEYTYDIDQRSVDEYTYDTDKRSVDEHTYGIDQRCVDERTYDIDQRSVDAERRQRRGKQENLYCPRLQRGQVEKRRLVLGLEADDCALVSEDGRMPAGWCN